MTSSSESPLAARDGRQNSPRLCEHCEMMGVSSVISADLKMQDIIYCAICNLKFSFFTEGSRVIVTKVESVGEDRKNA